MSTNKLSPGTTDTIIIDVLSKEDDLTTYEIAERNGFVKAAQVQSSIVNLRNSGRIVKTGTKKIFSKEKKREIAGCYTYSLPKKLRQTPPSHPQQTKIPPPKETSQEALNREQLTRIGKGVAAYMNYLENKVAELENTISNLSKSEKTENISVNIEALKDHINKNRV